MMTLGVARLRTGRALVNLSAPQPGWSWESMHAIGVALGQLEVAAGFVMGGLVIGFGYFGLVELHRLDLAAYVGAVAAVEVEHEGRGTIAAGLLVMRDECPGQLRVAEMLQVHGQERDL